MDVQIVVFPETKVAAIEHFVPPALEHDTAQKLIVWKLERRLLDPLQHRSYGVHFSDPRNTPDSVHHADFCLSFEQEVEPNPRSEDSNVRRVSHFALDATVAFNVLLRIDLSFTLLNY
jgi:AraC family transcriptional regulator